MATINQVKEFAEADTPLLFFECVLPSGDVEYWSTHAISFNNVPYSARVLKHNLFDLQLSADDAMDGITQLSVVLANADSYMSQLIVAMQEAGFTGLKGTQVTVYFAFADLPTGTITTESTILFRGISGDPDLIAEDSLTLSFTNKLSLQRIPVPEVRIQRSCPWNFPATLDQRTEALTGDRYSRYYRCGYSADVPGGVGSLSGGQAFTSCDKSRASCQARGMFDTDGSGNATQRFGGFEFVPSAILVRTAGDKTSHVSPLLDDPAKYNDPVPIVYGQGWLKAPVIFSRNDGNLTHIEVLAGMGTLPGTLLQPSAILKVVVNDIEIPLAVQRTDMTTTGWYNAVTLGDRTGNFNLDFTDSNGNALGDPYGSVSVISVVVPNRISSGNSLPNVELLLQGIAVDTYNADGTFQTGYSNNPVWVILDILRRCGWSISDLNLPTFVASAEVCQTPIPTTDLNGITTSVPRFQCNLVLTKRQSAATVIRGIRVASSLMLRYGPTGLLELLPEAALATQQSALPDGSNSIGQLNGGWPAYEFSDGSAPFSGIVRNPNGTSTVRVTSRSISETSNRLSVEFQDQSNEYQQDSLSIVDADDSALIGYEISSQSTALGVANFSQATRVLLRQLDKSTKGNLYIEFQTSFRALKVRPGDIITVTYVKEGYNRTPFRVVKLSPSVNYQLVTVLAQIHDDDWYSDDVAVLGGAGRQPGSNVQTPRPLIGLIRHNDANGNFEFFDFQIEEDIQVQANGSATDTLTVGFAQPRKPDPNSPNLPLLSLAPGYGATGGTLPGGSSFYYAVSAVDAAGNEGALSFTVPAMIPAGTNTNTVELVGLSFPWVAKTYNVYRGTSPQMLYQIASGQTIDPTQPTFLDTGAEPQPLGPPDASFDHANFYYRYEYGGPFIATGFSATTIVCADMGATNGAYANLVVRIIEGTGRGQERSISTNDQTTITITSPWLVMPDITSNFVVAEGSWRFAAVSATSPAQLEISYRSGAVIQVSGRGANVNNQEGTADLCPLTRWALGQEQADGGVPGVPAFVVGAPGGGEVTLSQIGFNDLANASSISSGTLQLFYWSELDTPSNYALAAPLDSVSTTVPLLAVPQSLADEQSSGIIQVGSELMQILSVDPTTNTYSTVRGVLGSAATAHNAGDLVLHLGTYVVIAPFASNFFANQASIDYIHTVSLPDVRISAAEFFVTNAFGDSQANQICYGSTPDGGLRTLSGGQFSLQVSGYLATQQNAAPPLVIEASHAVRDIRANLSQAAVGYAVSVEILQNGTPYCVMTVAPGNTMSGPPSASGIYPPPWPVDGQFPVPAVIDGVNLPPLQKEATLTLDITLQVDSGFTGSASPGRDLTVTIRL